VRVLQCVQGLDIGSTYGGAERAGAELARQLASDGHTVTLCAFWRYRTSAEAHWQQMLESDGVRVFFASDDTQTQCPRAFERAVQNIRRQLDSSVDVAHAHHDGGALAALLLKRSGHAHVAIHTMHIPIEKQWGTTRMGWLCRQVFTQTLFPLLLNQETAIAPHYVAALAHRPLARTLHRQPLLIHSPVPLRFAQPTSAARADDSRTEIVIGSVGRLNEQKGYRYLIEALPAVLSAFPSARLMLIGDGEQREILRRQATALGVSAHVTFAGQQDDMRACYAQMDLFVLPSLWEGVPAVVLESIASGVPVIASDLPGTRVLIENGVGGWLVPPAKAAALADAIFAALRDRAAASERARRAQTILKDFSAQAIAAQYVQLYRDLLNDETVRQAQPAGAGAHQSDRAQ